MDLVLGMGEVGSTLYNLLVSRKIKVSGFDIVQSKCRNYPPKPPLDVLHIACSFFAGFEKFVIGRCEERKPRYCMIHSTVPPGTAKKIQDNVSVTIITAPARGRHDRFLDDMMEYTKFYAFEGDDPDVREIMSDRFQKFKRAESNTSLELAKIMCDTTYLGLLVAYRKYVDEKAESLGVQDCDRMWEFAKEAHDRWGNRPIMFNDHKPIGGHCVLPNLSLLSTEFDEVISFINKHGGNHV